MIFIFSVIASIPYVSETGVNHGYSVCWFAILYIVGNYIYKYVSHINLKVKVYIYNINSYFNRKNYFTFFSIALYRFAGKDKRF